MSISFSPILYTFDFRYIWSGSHCAYNTIFSIFDVSILEILVSWAYSSSLVYQPANTRFSWSGKSFNSIFPSSTVYVVGFNELSDPCKFLYSIVYVIGVILYFAITVISSVMFCNFASSSHPINSDL